MTDEVDRLRIQNEELLARSGKLTHAAEVFAVELAEAEKKLDRLRAENERLQRERDELTEALHLTHRWTHDTGRHETYWCADCGVDLDEDQPASVCQAVDRARRLLGEGE